MNVPEQIAEPILCKSSVVEQKKNWNVSNPRGGRVRTVFSPTEIHNIMNTFTRQPCTRVTVCGETLRPLRLGDNDKTRRIFRGAKRTEHGMTSKSRRSSIGRHGITNGIFLKIFSFSKRGRKNVGISDRTSVDRPATGKWSVAAEVPGASRPAN